MPRKHPAEASPSFREAYLAEEREWRVNTGQVACLLVIVLMPLGALLDHFYFNSPAKFEALRAHFLSLRLWCSVVMVGVWFLQRTRIAREHYPMWVGMPIVWVPSAFITWMIFKTEGPESPYYAGLNLIVLGVSALGHWSARLSVVAVTGVTVMYAAACLRFPGGLSNLGVFFNNLYFLALTGVIVVSGNYLFNRLRFREFLSRFELDQNRKKLEETNQKLIELDQVKSRFFANVSHELRTPLTLLIAPLESLLHRYAPAFDADTRQLLDTMHANSMRLLKLINDLLDIVRLESGHMKVHREPLELDPFIRGLASAARQVADDKRITLATTVAPELGVGRMDRDKLEKVLLNLVFNALKFTPAGGRVELRAAREGNHVVLTVSDTGVGIAAKNLPFVFDRFWQADGSIRRKYQGVGIGLALVKELVELQDGQVSVTSEEGRGTTFAVKLPWEEAARPASAETQAAPPTTPDERTVSSEEWLTNLYRRAELFPAMSPLQDAVRPDETARTGDRFTVLVADDEPDMLRFLKSQLSSEYNVIEASDGMQAVEKAGQLLPDIALLDVMMPIKDGLQVCRELRQQASTQTIPIVLLTARADEETKLAALEAGASDFLAKPFSSAELHARLRNLVASHDYQMQLSRQNRLLESTLDQLKETETQLVQAAKLASLGRMSAGIIHEINNPLNFATTGLFTLRNKAKLLPSDQQAEYSEILRDVEEGIARVKNIVTDLRTFSHPEVTQREPVDVAGVVTAARRFLSGEFKNGVHLEVRLPERQTVIANRNKLLQVVVNLVQNALDALNDRKPPAERPTIWIEGRVEGGRSRLSVRDNGVGIAPQHLDKIFDPFFTTKDVGQGMGLGLSICYRIVQEYGGQIIVKTEPGQFSEFILDFPAAD